MGKNNQCQKCQRFRDRIELKWVRNMVMCGRCQQEELAAYAKLGCSESQPGGDHAGDGGNRSSGGDDVGGVGV